MRRLSPVLRAALAGAAGLLTLQASAQAPAPVELQFARFFRQPVGPRGLEFDPALLAADGQQVRLAGYMVQQEQARPGRFLLSPRPLRLSEHAAATPATCPPPPSPCCSTPASANACWCTSPALLALSGRLEVGRQEDADGRVTWLRLTLPPQALAETAVLAAPAELHSH